MKYERVHGEIRVQRRSLEITNWKEHKEDLVRDFSNICGYCGKNFIAVRGKSQIDHFIPRSDYPEYENKYSNLVLSCPTCNNKKHGDWPSKNPKIYITEMNEGYIDPADVTYDDHFKRLSDGNIVGITDVGKYVYKRLGFDSRPIAICWKALELHKRTVKFREKVYGCNISSEQCRDLNKIFYMLEELRDHIAYAKEN
ncbi:MAG: HNH endonuclease [Firmicutes bacterium]|nr:HNH endonuclease [Bacillota bacterium]